MKEAMASLWAQVYAAEYAAVRYKIARQDPAGADFSQAREAHEQATRAATVAVSNLNERFG